MGGAGGFRIPRKPIDWEFGEEVAPNLDETGSKLMEARDTGVRNHTQKVRYIKGINQKNSKEEKESLKNPPK